MTDQTKEKPYISWDTCDITEGELEYRKETWQERYPDVAEDEDGNPCCPDDDYIRNDIYNDPGYWEFEWDSMTEDLSNLMEEMNPSGRWTASVKGFGWQNLDGELPEFKVENGQELINKVLPDCEKIFEIYRIKNKYGIEGMRIICSHHDSPMGELYYVFPVDKLEEQMDRISEMIEDGSLFENIAPIELEVEDEVPVV
jgi:hypothetical protein